MQSVETLSVTAPGTANDAFAVDPGRNNTTIKVRWQTNVLATPLKLSVTLRARVYAHNVSGTNTWTAVGSDMSSVISPTALAKNIEVTMGSVPELSKTGNVDYYSVLAWSIDDDGSGDTPANPTTCASTNGCMLANISLEQSPLLSIAGPTITGCNPCDPSHTANDRTITVSGTVGYQFGARGNDYMTVAENATIKLYQPGSILVTTVNMAVSTTDGTYSGSINLPTPTEAGNNWSVSVDYCHDSDCIPTTTNTFTVKLEVESVTTMAYDGSLNPCGNAVPTCAGKATGEEDASTVNRDEYMIVKVKLYNPDNANNLDAKSVAVDPAGTNNAMTFDTFMDTNADTVNDTIRFYYKIPTNYGTGSKIVRASATVQGAAVTTTATGIANDPSGCGSSPLCHNQDDSVTVSASLSFTINSSGPNDNQPKTVLNRGEDLQYNITVRNARGDAWKNRDAANAGANDVTATARTSSTSYATYPAGTTNSSGVSIQSGTGNTLTMLNTSPDTYAGSTATSDWLLRYSFGGNTGDTSNFFDVSDDLKLSTASSGAPDNGIITKLASGDATQTATVFNQGETVFMHAFIYNIRNERIAGSPLTPFSVRILTSTNAQDGSTIASLNPNNADSDKVSWSYVPDNNDAESIHDDVGAQKHVEVTDSKTNQVSSANEWGVSDLLNFDTDTTFGGAGVDRATTDCVANGTAATCANEPGGEETQFNHGENVQASGFLFNVRQTAKAGASSLVFRSQTGSCGTNEGTNFTGTTTDASGGYSVTRVVQNADTDAGKWLRAEDTSANYVQQCDTVSGAVTGEWSTSKVMSVSSVGTSIDNTVLYKETQFGATESLFNRGENVDYDFWVYSVRGTKVGRASMNITMLKTSNSTGEGSCSAIQILDTGQANTNSSSQCQIASTVTATHDTTGDPHKIRYDDTFDNNNVDPANTYGVSDLAYVSTSATGAPSNSVTIKVGGSAISPKVVNFGEAATIEFYYRGARSGLGTPRNHTLPGTTFNIANFDIGRASGASCGSINDRTLTPSSQPDSTGLVSMSYTPTSGTDQAAHDTTGDVKCLKGGTGRQDNFTNYFDSIFGSATWAVSDLVRFDTDGAGSPDNNVVMTQTVYNLGETVSGTFYTIGGRGQALNFANSCAVPATDTKCTIIYKNASSTQEGNSRKFNLTPSSGQVTFSYTATNGTDAGAHDDVGDQKRISWRDTNDNFAGTSDAQFANKYGVSDLLNLDTDSTFGGAGQDRVTTDCIANGTAATCANEPGGEETQFNHGENVQAQSFLFGVRSNAKASMTGLILTSQTSCGSNETTNFTGSTTNVSGQFTVTRVVRNADTNAGKWLKVLDSAGNYVQQCDAVSGTITNEWTVSASMSVSTNGASIDNNLTYNFPVYNRGETVDYDFWLYSARGTRVGRNNININVVDGTGMSCPDSSVGDTGQVASGSSACVIAGTVSAAHNLTGENHRLAVQDDFNNNQVTAAAGNIFAVSDATFISSSASSIDDSVNLTFTGNSTPQTYNFGETVSIQFYYYGARGALLKGFAFTGGGNGQNILRNNAGVCDATERTFNVASNGTTGSISITYTATSGTDIPTHSTTGNRKCIGGRDTSQNTITKYGAAAGPFNQNRTDSLYGISDFMRTSVYTDSLPTEQIRTDCDYGECADEGTGEETVFNRGEQVHLRFKLYDVRSNVRTSLGNILTLNVHNGMAGNEEIISSVNTDASGIVDRSYTVAAGDAALDTAGGQAKRLEVIDNVQNKFLTTDQVDQWAVSTLVNLCKTNAATYGACSGADQGRIQTSSTLDGPAVVFNRGEDVNSTFYYYSARGTRVNRTGLSLQVHPNSASHTNEATASPLTYNNPGEVRWTYYVATTHEATNDTVGTLKHLNVVDNSNGTGGNGIESGNDWGISTLIYMDSRPGITSGFNGNVNTNFQIYNLAETVSIDFYYYTVRNTPFANQSGSTGITLQMIDNGSLTTEATLNNASITGGNGRIAWNVTVPTGAIRTHDKTGSPKKLKLTHNSNGTGGNGLTSANAWAVSDLWQYSTSGSSINNNLTVKDATNASAAVFNRGEVVTVEAFVYGVRDNLQLNKTGLTTIVLNASAGAENTQSGETTDGTGKLVINYTIAAGDTATHDTTGSQKQLKLRDNTTDGGSGNSNYVQSANSWGVSDKLNMGDGAGTQNGLIKTKKASGDVTETATLFNRGETIFIDTWVFNIRNQALNAQSVDSAVHKPAFDAEPPAATTSEASIAASTTAADGKLAISYAVGAAHGNGEANINTQAGVARRLRINWGGNYTRTTQSEWNISSLIQIDVWTQKTSTRQSTKDTDYVIGADTNMYVWTNTKNVRGEPIARTGVPGEVRLSIENTLQKSCTPVGTNKSWTYNTEASDGWVTNASADTNKCVIAKDSDFVSPARAVGGSREVKSNITDDGNGNSGTFTQVVNFKRGDTDRKPQPGDFPTVSGSDTGTIAGTNDSVQGTGSSSINNDAATPCNTRGTPTAQSGCHATGPDSNYVDRVDPRTNVVSLQTTETITGAGTGVVDPGGVITMTWNYRSTATVATTQTITVRGRWFASTFGGGWTEVGNSNLTLTGGAAGSFTIDGLGSMSNNQSFTLDTKTCINISCLSGDIDFYSLTIWAPEFNGVANCTTDPASDCIRANAAIAQTGNRSYAGNSSYANSGLYWRQTPIVESANYLPSRTGQTTTINIKGETGYRNGAHGADAGDYNGTSEAPTVEIFAPIAGGGYAASPTSTTQSGTLDANGAFVRQIALPTAAQAGRWKATIKYRRGTTARSDCVGSSNYQEGDCAPLDLFFTVNLLVENFVTEGRVSDNAANSLEQVDADKFDPAECPQVGGVPKLNGNNCNGAYNLGVPVRVRVKVYNNPLDFGYTTAKLVWDQTAGETNLLTACGGSTCYNAGTDIFDVTYTTFTGAGDARAGFIRAVLQMQYTTTDSVVVTKDAQSGDGLSVHDAAADVLKKLEGDICHQSNTPARGNPCTYPASNEYNVGAGDTMYVWTLVRNVRRQIVSGKTTESHLYRGTTQLDSWTQQSTGADGWTASQNYQLTSGIDLCQIHNIISVISDASGNTSTIDTSAIPTDLPTDKRPTFINCTSTNSGELVSSTFDAGGMTYLNSISWRGTKPAGSTVKFQIAVCSEPTDPAACTWGSGDENYFGPTQNPNSSYDATDKYDLDPIDGGAGTTQLGVNSRILTATGRPINYGRFFRYKIYLTKTSTTPIVTDVIINYQKQ